MLTRGEIEEVQAYVFAYDTMPNATNLGRGKGIALWSGGITIQKGSTSLHVLDLNLVSAVSQGINILSKTGKWYKYLLGYGLPSIRDTTSLQTHRPTRRRIHTIS